MQLRFFTIVNDTRWRLLLKGLPFDVTTEEIRSIFSNNGSIQSVSIVGKGSEPTGCAVVRFESEVEAVRALKNFRDIYIRKRKIFASLDFTDFSQRIQRVYKPIAVDRFRLPLRFF
ncbi:multiple RNA-binding domain-containing protein 1 [Babesia caballi]|uniref:Multiple RNA-binding domain-containing protein 1 n=1 Tax=Babesia caballi TaxID=5871 RepID=A0AAV4M022_BABCB|nr:multiple RNA-binding domain-containing protein 1 [Babesia caballi]